jgi:hypothetical protein
MTACVPESADPVAAFMPWLGENERQLRRRILRCQQTSATSARTAGSDRARGLYWTACEIAGETAFAPASPEHLQDVIATLTRLFMAAGAIEDWSAAHGR